MKLVNASKLIKPVTLFVITITVGFIEKKLQEKLVESVTEAAKK